MKKSERESVYNKYGGKCAYCGCVLEKGWHVDHLEPCRRSRKYIGGKWVDNGYANEKANHIDNYMPACPSCNINKHSDTLEQFRENIYRYIWSLNQRFVQYKMAKKFGLIKETDNPVIFYFEKCNQ